jgi:hypothetical protein
MRYTLLSVVTIASLVAPLAASARSISDFPGVTHVSRRQLQPAVQSCKNVRTKEVTIGGSVIAKVPATWVVSVAKGDTGMATGFDDFPKHIFFSVGQKNVTYSDLNGGQLDAVKMTGANVRSLENWYKSTAEAGDSWSIVRVGGRSVDVLTFPLDHGQVTKGGTGGRVYFFAWTPKEALEPRGKDMGLVVWKQAQGDTAFECGSDAFISSLDLSAFAAAFRDAYPSKR